MRILPRNLASISGKYAYNVVCGNVKLHRYSTCEDTNTYWENGRAHLQIHLYPVIIAFLGYYPFAYETESVGGKITKVRYCKGWNYATMEERFGVNASTILYWKKQNKVKDERKRFILLSLFSLQ